MMSANPTTRVLAIEDDLGLSRLIQRRLERAGYDVECAFSAEDGLQRWAEGGFQVLLTDHILPNKTGLDVLRALAEQGDMPPVVMITGGGSEHVAVEALKLGASEYIVKDTAGNFLDLLPTVLEQVLRQAQVRQEHRAAVEALRTSEDRYRSVVEDQTDLIFRADIQGSITFANPAFRRFFDFPAGMPEIPLEASPFAADRMRLMQLAAQLTPENATASIEQHIQDKHLGEHRINWTFRGIFDPSGTLIEVQGVGWDITERYAMEEQLRQSELKLRTLFQRSNDFLFLTDETGRITNWNAAGEALTGFSINDVQGKYIWDIQYQLIHPENRSPEKYQKVYAALSRLLTLDESEYSGKIVESELHAKDGSTRISQQKITVIPTQKGRTLFGIIRDITEYARAARELRERDLRLRMIAENILDVICETDLNGMLRYVSPSSLTVFGCLPETLLGMSVQRFFAHTDQPDFGSFLAQVSSQNIPGKIEHHFQRPDGSLIWLESIASPLKNEAGALAGIVINSRDITQRKEAEESLRVLNQELSTWVSELEHRNSEVTTINEMGEMLQSCQSWPDAFQVVSRYAQRLFPSQAGALFSYTESKEWMEAAVSWGSPQQTGLSFGPQDCWALRRGRVHRLDPAHSPLFCAHSQKPAPGEAALHSICIPLIAQTESLGIFYLELAPGQSLNHWEALAVMVADRIALALANLGLRVTLHEQAIRDPLTKCFNRRFMEATLEREVTSAQRHERPLALIMLDIDHFKHFNDHFSYAAGDALLVELADLLLQNVRSSDVVCRYGGEEFMLILLESNLDNALRRASEIQILIRNLRIIHRGQPLGAVTVSLGVASFPQHGTTGEELLRSVDTALHHAKNTGRDRISIAE